ncbi:MAG: DUF362 domain-containing protein [Candidatus Ancaeobacter aquaticus]|nr:DUF362 domain-containing protein [Candidatus Ancaeobacter aquaticus]
MNRRKFLKLLSLTGVGTYLFGSGSLKNMSVQSLFAEKTPPYDIALVKNSDIPKNVKTAIDLVGGINRFITKGDIVMIKPNLGWARTPEQAANTNPTVLRTIIELCFQAGAKKVRITDNTCNDPRKTFALSGAHQVAKETGAELFYSEKWEFKEMNINGNVIKDWPVNREIISADKIINVPIAKNHALAKLTLGMKNWFGAVGGARNQLHQDINETISDLACYFKPTLTIIDAIRILVRNGPTGGNLNDVVVKDTIIASTDPVAADSLAATLFSMKGSDLGYIVNAEKRGLGTMDYNKLRYKELIHTVT